MSGIEEVQTVKCKDVKEAKQVQDDLRECGISSTIVLRQYQYYVRYVQHNFTLHGADE